jgi:predicted secreted acid phosphatase
VSGGSWFAARVDLYWRLATDFTAWVAAGAPAGAVSGTPGDFISWVMGGGSTDMHALAVTPSTAPMAAVFEIDDVILASFHRGNYVTSPSPCVAGVDFHAADWFDTPEADGLAWPRDAVFAPAVPGIHKLLDAVRACGVTVVFVTRRPEARRAETMANLALVGLWADAAPNAAPDAAPNEAPNAAPLGDILLMWPGSSRWPSVARWKELQRQILRDTYRVVLNVGTRPSDFGYYAESVVHAFTPFYET